MPIDRDATLKSAEKLLRQGKLDAAIAEYVRLTAAQPHDWNSLNALGDLYLRAGQPDRAVTQFTRAAEQLVRESASARAAAVYKKILRINPGDSRAAQRLASIEVKAAARSKKRPGVPTAAADDPDAKVRAARAALDLEDIQQACTLLVEAAGLYETRRRPWDALAAIAEASAADPTNHALRERMLQILIAQGEIVQARYVARGSAELLMVADAFAHDGRQAEALDIIDEAAAFDPRDAPLRERALRQFVRSGEIERARRLAQSSPELLIVAEALAREGRSGDVLDVTEEAVRWDPGNAGLREHFVSACLAAGDIRRATDVARSATDWLTVAAALRGQDRRTEALEAMGQALRREPENAALHADFVSECLLAGDVAQARTTARTTAERLAVAEALQRQGDAADALHMRIEAAQHDPGRAELWVEVARELALAGDLTQAMRMARTVPELMVLAELVAQEGRAPDVRELMTEAARRDPDNVPLRVRLAHEYIEAGDPSHGRLLLRTPTELVQVAERLATRAEAVALLEEAVRLDPGNAELRMRVIREYVRSGDLTHARSISRTTAERLMVADALEECGEAAAALQLRAAAAQSDPENAELWMRVARESALAGDIPQAIRTARTAPELLSLADLLAGQGRKAGARELMTEAARWDPENADLRLRLALEYFEAGEAERARLILRTPSELVRLAECLGGRPEALGLLDEASRLDPDNVNLRHRVAREWVLVGDVRRAQALARSSPELLGIARLLEEQGRREEALAVMVEAAERDPSNLAFRAQVGCECAEAGSVEHARRFLTPETAGDDPVLLLALARLELYADRVDEGRQALARLAMVRPELRVDVLRLSGDFAEAGREALAYVCAEVCADAALLEQKWEAAATALQEFVSHAPGHVAALTKLVEIYVDGGFDGRMAVVQAELADAYLAAGRSGEARVIAEDLIMREPWAPQNVERCRRVLRMTGEADPDRVIAELLCGDHPFSFEEL